MVHRAARYLTVCMGVTIDAALDCTLNNPDLMVHVLHSSAAS